MDLFIGPLVDPSNVLLIGPVVDSSNVLMDLLSGPLVDSGKLFDGFAYWSGS